jgi:heme/copper-type cytochrome/quinol oxidase subunit 4
MAAIFTMIGALVVLMIILAGVYWVSKNIYFSSYTPNGDSK